MMRLHPGKLEFMSRQRHSHTQTQPPQGAEPEGGQRLQKLLARAGLGSRRKCEELILEGRVEVNRKVVTTLGAKADPRTEEIRVDGIQLRRPKLLYYAVHKPQGVVSTNHDPSGRPRVVDLLPPSAEHLFTVGRLDMSSEGLMLVTNDGELANRLAHPRYGVEKTYHVEVAGRLEIEDLVELRKGIHLAEGFARVVGARIKTQLKKSTLLEIVLNEGRNREIRRLLARVGHKVLRLRRIALGPLRLGELPPGRFRVLERDEIAALRTAAGGQERASKKRRRPTGGARTPDKPAPAGRKRSAAKDSAAPRQATVIGGDSVIAGKKGIGARVIRREKAGSAKPMRPRRSKPARARKGARG